MGVDIPVVAGRRELMTPERPIWLSGRESYLVDQTVPVSNEDILDAYCDTTVSRFWRSLP